MTVCCPSTPAQYFHMLRRQMRQPDPKPLIVMTPKSLLRLPDSSSHISEIADGSFQPVIDDSASPAGVRRLLLCTGKIYFELRAELARSGRTGIALARVEQLYPFPATLVRGLVEKYREASEIVWVQEEPANMGAWHFVFPRLHRIVGSSREIRYAGRAAGASPATGNHAVHVLEQKRLLDEALG